VAHPPLCGRGRLRIALRAFADLSFSPSSLQLSLSPSLRRTRAIFVAAGASAPPAGLMRIFLSFFLSVYPPCGSLPPLWHPQAPSWSWVHPHCGSFFLSFSPSLTPSLSLSHPSSRSCSLLNFPSSNKTGTLGNLDTKTCQPSHQDL
jgi:hypothetical protein